MKRSLLLALMLFGVLFSAMAQKMTVKGTIKDGTGEVLPGATVTIKGTTTGTVSGADGTYSIEVPNGEAILIFSFVGYDPQEITVGTQTTIDVMLVEGTALEEVVVTGFTTDSKKTLTSSITSVKADDFKNVSVASFDGILQGRVAGVNISSAGGQLGSATTISIRGIGSVNASSQPLVVVDGVVLTNGNFGSAAGGQGLNALSNINPNDIASFEILKDAAATALYGSRGSNGVIVITTKRGQFSKGKPNVSFGAYIGFTDATDVLDQLNGDQFAEMWNYANEGRFGEGNVFYPIARPDGAPSTDWVDEVTRTGLVQEYYANVSGGDENTSYYLGATQRNEEGYTINNQLERYSIRLNLDQKISDKVRVGLSVSPTRTVINRVPQDNAVAAPLTNAYLNYPGVANTDANGNLILDELSDLASLGVATQFGAGSPTINLIEAKFQTDNFQILANANLVYEIIPDLKFKTEIGVESWIFEEDQKRGERTIGGDPAGFGLKIHSNFFNYTWSNTVNYAFNINNKHNFNVLAGIQYQESSRTTTTAAGNSFPLDQLKTLNSAATPTTAAGTGTEFNFVGYLTRIQYNIDNKYLFSVSARYDGSSRFGVNERYGFFPAVSAGWNISDEDFMSGADFISNLKLRASYGRTGNGEIGNFDSRSLAGASAYRNNPGLIPTQLGDPNLKWETTDQLDISLEFGVLNDRVRGTLTYFDRDTKDLLLDRPLPATSGFPNILQNVGSLSNSGFEVELAADIIQSEGDGFNWTTSLNLSTIKNEVTELVDGNDILFAENILREGEPLGAFYLVGYAGVDPTNGDGLYEARDADGVVTGTGATYSADFRYIAGDPFPDFFGGFTNNFSYKGFDLSVFFQYSIGNDLYREEGEFVETNLASIFNQSVSQLDYWTPDNTTASLPEPRLFRNNGARASTRYLEDGSFIRLKTISLGYTLPQSLTKDYNVRVFVQGQNLLTITDYNGADPEVNSARSGNSNVSRGNTFFAAPQQKTVAFGVNVNF